MKKLLLRWLLLAVSIVVASAISSALGLGFKADLGGWQQFLKLLVGVLVLALLNATLGNFLKFVTLPISCITLGLFSLVVNAVVLMLAANLRFGFHIEGAGFPAFVSAFVASLLISFINGVLGNFLPDDKDD